MADDKCRCECPPECADDCCKFAAPDVICRKTGHPGTFDTDKERKFWLTTRGDWPLPSFLPEISIRRGGIRFPLVHVRLYLEEDETHGWFLCAEIAGSNAARYLGPFKKKRKAEAFKSQLTAFLRDLDAHYKEKLK